MLLVSYPPVFVLSCSDAFFVSKISRLFFLSETSESLHCSSNNNNNKNHNHHQNNRNNRNTTTTTNNNNNNTSNNNNNKNNSQWCQVCPPSAGMKQFHQDQTFLPRWKLAFLLDRLDLLGVFFEKCKTPSTKTMFFGNPWRKLIWWFGDFFGCFGDLSKV